jgi:L-cysteine S-thiosulfotransferase
VIARAFALSAAVMAWPAIAQDVAHPQPPRPGVEFQGEDVRRLQADDFANPGMLAVAQGEKLWSEKFSGSERPCVVCHGNAAKSMRGVAPRYPRFDAGLGRVVNLAGRIEACQRENGGGAGLAPESVELVSLDAFITHQSRGMPMAVSTGGPARASFERGAALYRTRIGQLNLACTHCHDANWGKTLLAEPISQGHPTGWPAYRLEWQSIGSLQRRLRACFFGVRAEQPAYGSDDLVSLELYLAVRAGGMAIETPGVRR